MVAQGLRAGPDILEVQERDLVRQIEQVAALEDRHEASGIAHRQRPQKDAADHRKDLGVDGDAKGQGQDDDGVYPGDLESWRKANLRSESMGRAVF